MSRNLLVAALFVLPATILASDSPSFRGDPEHPGIYDTAPVAKFTRLKWKFQTKGIVLSSPAVVGDTLYVGSADHNLYALDIATGTQKWAFKTASSVASSPAVANGTVYFLSYDGNFYAVDAADGKLRWKFQTGGERRFAAKHLHGSQPTAETMPDPRRVSPRRWCGRARCTGCGDGSVVFTGQPRNPELEIQDRGRGACFPSDFREGYCTSARIRTSTRLTRRPAKKSGASKRERIPMFTIRWEFSGRGG
jgi:hypothetical protein